MLARWLRNRSHDEDCGCGDCTTDAGTVIGADGSFDRSLDWLPIEDRYCDCPAHRVT